jgi:large subunit ribosomal protein L32
VTCESCGASVLRHRACPSCGNYRGKRVIDVAAKAQKRAEKKQTREKAEAAPAAK